MVAITFVQPDGERVTVEAVPGTTVMEAARDNGVDGIDAICGGLCACATCHGYLEPEWFERLGPPSAGEQGLIEFAWEPRETSRLTCQLEVDESLDGLVVRLPEQQA